MAYGDPPKRNYGPRAGSKKKIRPSFSANTSGPQSGLGPAYNSSKDPRGPDAYVPVPDSRAATQHKRTVGRVGSKPGLDGRYHKGDQFLSYEGGSSPSGPQKRQQIPRIYVEDAPEKGKRLPAKQRKGSVVRRAIPKYGDLRVPKKEKRRKTGDAWIG